ncbi:unnamed protein product [Clavelina lepadiformis]|uniref:RFX-type winged-helix domain-containing protein n=1 Tax=Clavelina lepadiformis TaxID=159417 RepID=A0ABP0H0E0_CLALP
MPRQKNPKPQQCAKPAADNYASCSPEGASSDVESADPRKHSFNFHAEVDDVSQEKDVSSIAGCQSEVTSEQYAIDIANGKWSPSCNIVQQQNNFDHSSQGYSHEPSLKSTDLKAEKKSRLSLGLLNPKIMQWLTKNFTMKEGARTSASQVVKIYEKEFSEETPYVPLQNYQVGQLLRRLFPDIQRCKITVLGKRVWVYKDLCVVDKHSSVEKDPTNVEREKKSPDQDDFHNERVLLGYHKAVTGPAFSNHDLEKTKPKSDKKRVKNSGILYNLLYPNSQEKRINSTKTDKYIEELAKDNKKEGNIIQWLRDTYEYADGYYVKSMDVLRLYNRGRDTWVKYLSQVGRVVKHVFPKARHLRRSLKGGKREWVYHNIRPKDHTEVDVWHGSNKHLTLNATPESYLSGVSLLPFQHFVLDKQPSPENESVQKSLTSLFHRLDGEENVCSTVEEACGSGDDLCNDKIDKNDADTSPANDNYLFNFRPRKSTISTSPVAQHTNFNVFYKATTESGKDGKEGPKKGNSCTLSTTAQKHESDSSDDLINRTPTIGEESEAKALGLTEKISQLRSQIDCAIGEARSSSECTNAKSTILPCATDPTKDMNFKVKEEPTSEAEDLSMTGLQGADGHERSKKRNHVSAFGSCARNKVNDLVSKATELNKGSPKVKRDRRISPSQTQEHNYFSSEINDKDLVGEQSTNETDHENFQAVRIYSRSFEAGNRSGKEDVTDAASSTGSGPIPSLPELKKFLRWEDLAVRINFISNVESIQSICCEILQNVRFVRFYVDRMTIR